ncbi:hypothetical protein EDB19DRAFT_1915401 [Suillus lakei]|nr:hypothetical protein EDB19DRAFT_1915401 [Suillus lakei]
MPAVLTNVATVYPDVQCQDTDDATLKPLFFTVKFSGTLPRHLIDQNIPIEISVSIAEEYGCFTMLVLNAMSVGLWRSGAGSSLHSGDLNSSDICPEYTLPPDDILIPFLPLPPAFNYTVRADWAMLSKQIEKWLIELDTELPQWTWGQGHILVGVHCRISLFSERYLADVGSPQALGHSAMVDQENLATDLGDAEDLKEIWNAFCRDAALFYPCPLISTD